MTTTTLATGRSRSISELYAEVQQFYAGQVRLLDTMQADAFADSFTEDGVFDHRPGADPLVGRAAISAAIRAYQETKHAVDPVQRRHWFNMVQVFPQDDGSIRTEYYAVVYQTRPNVSEPLVGPSCFVTDVLEFEGDELRTRFRKVSPDYEV
ncbi:MULTISPECIES: nuclear transport factor 2 family protein [Streptomyces]|uniref:nuclear transport factor 2 family protein n=1 Tax=Streptomyces TaxID=1883 RepID=UPI001CB76B34|nr:nuclear transport factor 2 family protein [Streptomyces xanthii]